MEAASKSGCLQHFRHRRPFGSSGPPASAIPMAPLLRPIPRSLAGVEITFPTGGMSSAVPLGSCKCSNSQRHRRFLGSGKSPRAICPRQQPLHFESEKSFSSLSAFLRRRSCGFSSTVWGASLQRCQGSRSSRSRHRADEGFEVSLSVDFVSHGGSGAMRGTRPSLDAPRASLPWFSPPKSRREVLRDPFQKQRKKRKRLSHGIQCIGASAGAALATAKPVLDQILLLGTVVGVYIAGLSSAPRVPQRSSANGRSVERKGSRTKEAVRRVPEQVFEDDWARLQSKISRALSRKSTDLAAEAVVRNPVLALQALAQVPRLHLLLTTLHYIQKEAKAISDEDRGVASTQWQGLALTALSRSIAPICSDWLLEETGHRERPSHATQSDLAPTTSYRSRELPGSFRVDGQEGDGMIPASTEMDVLDSMMQNLKDSESVASYMARSGKAGLYADLVFFLRFKAFRRGGCCDDRVFRQHRENALEDMVVSVAEVVASLFLDCASSGNLNPYGDMWQTFLSPSILSTRSLERFRNEVALYSWLNQNFASVTAMFEDRFDLWTVQMKRTPSARKKQRRNQPNDSSLLEERGMEGDLMLTRAQLPARRGTELKALKGWKYSYSLFLELSDVVGPLLRLLATKFGEGISFLLITLIGRSLGLVYQGIRQSVRWPSMRKNNGVQ